MRHDHCILRVLLGIFIYTGLTFCSADPAPKRFGIYTAHLDGSHQYLIVGDHFREMTHARVSPDKRWITFTRYNKRDRFGLARERNGYQNTEIVLARINGRNVQAIVPAKNGIINANSSWTPDGKNLIYITTDNFFRRPQINMINLKTRRISRLPISKRLMPTDPHWVKNKLVFPVRTAEPKGLWLMRSDGTRLRRLTYPKVPKPARKGPFLLGDYDPRFSKDGSKVAFMRYFGFENWHIIVMDLKTGKERDLSAAKTVDGLPDWSSDNRLLMFWHADRKRLHETGLYTMRPDGSQRHKIPLPSGYLHRHSAFFPGEGSGRRSRIIFVAMKF